jgi:hypothetical protein
MMFQRTKLGRYFVYGNVIIGIQSGHYCAGGHPIRRPWQRTLRIIIRDKAFEVIIQVRPTDPFKTPVCGKCLGIE